MHTVEEYPATISPALLSSPSENFTHDPDDWPDADPLDALVISDIHLGSDNCQAKALTAFLQQILDGEICTRQLIIAGDVFDSIDFRRLKKNHWKVLSQIRHLSDKIDIVWIAGNHDGSADIVSHLLGVRVVEQYIFSSGDQKILVVHGHVFDDFIEDHPFLTWIADSIYYILQQIDRSHYIARLAKSRSKVFVRCMEKIQRGAIALARDQGCQVAICGHTHLAKAVTQGDVHYFNSGCWTENPTSYLTIRRGRVELHRHLTAAIEGQALETELASA